MEVSAIPDGGQLEVGVRDAHGRPTSTRLQAKDGEVVVITPPGGGFKLNPETELKEYQQALKIVGEVALKQRRGPR